MAHLQKQITVKQAWVEVETDNGTEYLDAATLGLMVRDSQNNTHPLTDKQREQIISKMSQYVQGTIQEWKTIRGYGARMSAPGYLDCTDWTVFETAEEAEEFLKNEIEFF
jgi:hypothetical protein